VISTIPGGCTSSPGNVHQVHHVHPDVHPADRLSLRRHSCAAAWP